MKVLKYLRLGNARFVSHIDVLRQAARILRRAEIPVKYSQGFNPHALVFFSPPCSVGVGSLAEYVAIDTDMSAEEVMERYNAAVGADMRAVKSFDVAGNPNLAGRIVAADYLFPCPVGSYAAEKGLRIEFSKKGETVCEDATERIFGVSEKDGLTVLTLAAGNVTLRADRVFDAFRREGLCAGALPDTLKLAQYVRAENGVLRDVDDYLSSFPTV